MATQTPTHVGNPIPAMTVYQPLERPIVVIGSYFLAQYPVDLNLSNKVMTLGENDWKIKDVNGTIIFKIKSKLFSVHDRRYLLDASDNKLATFQQKIMTTRRRWNAFRGDSTDPKDLMFTVRKSSILQLKTQLDVFLPSNTEEKVPDFHIVGSWSESSCTITLGDSKAIIAQMYRKHSMKSMLLDTDNYNVTIYPNVDYAFIIALVVVLDEVNADRSGQD